ncbi:MAG: potassium transporter Kef [Patescibacteria group bacterium]|nr:MAG: potassium transporter Kef [Patescibacteria group bacterium]
MSVFVELSIIIVVAALLSGAMRLLRQPLVIGYVLTGVMLGPHFLGVLKSAESMSAFSEMGIAILLFIVGLHLNPKELKNFGTASFLIGFLQVLLTTFFGFIISAVLKFSPIEGLYIGLGLSFSSTIVVLKFLSDKKDLEKLYGRLSIGILLLEDILAAVALIVVSGTSEGMEGLPSFLLLIIKGLILVLAVSLTSYYVMPALGTFLARSQEYLFLFSLAWGFGLAVLFGNLGFSIEVGALIAGVSLSILPYSAEISSRLKPLRDFFVVMFFIYLGYEISFDSLTKMVVPLAIFISYVLLIKPLIFALLIELFGYSKKTAFLGGSSLSQISEFSLILALLGLKVGHLSEDTVSLITILGFLSIAVSSYFIVYAEKIYPLFVPFLKLFEKKTVVADTDIARVYDTILFGCNRAGYDFVKIFKEFGKQFLAVDFDPDIVKELTSKGINCIYGDAEDAEFLDEISVGKAKIVISTIPEFETNNFLLNKVRSENPDSLVVLISYNIDEAIKLYEGGATYVILPHFIGGEFAVRIISEAGFDVKKLSARRDEHVNYLRERKKLGHAHPVWTHSQ